MNKIKQFLKWLFYPTVDELPEPCKKVYTTEPDGTGIFFIKTEDNAPIDNGERVQYAADYVAKSKLVEEPPALKINEEGKVVTNMEFKNPTKKPKIKFISPEDNKPEAPKKKKRYRKPKNTTNL